MSTKTALVGQVGEVIALQYLRTKGYKLYAKNVRLGRDEIDLICYDKQCRCLVFTEVKARTKATKAFGPQSNLHFKKRQKLFRSANRWLAEHHYNGPRRIDAVLVVGGQVVEHLQGLSM